MGWNAFRNNDCKRFMTVIGALILYRFRFLDKKLFALTSIAVWGLLGIVVIALYSHFYWTREWHITEMTPGLVFGCHLICGSEIKIHRCELGASQTLQCRSLGQHKTRWPSDDRAASFCMVMRSLIAQTNKIELC